MSGPSTLGQIIESEDSREEQIGAIRGSIARTSTITEVRRVENTIENTLLNVRKTARLLDVHPNTLRNWANQGRLPCYTVNSRGDRRFRLEDIEDFLARHRRSSAPPTRLPTGHKSAEQVEQGANMDRLPAGYLDARAVRGARA